MLRASLSLKPTPRPKPSSFTFASLPSLYKPNIPIPSSDSQSYAGFLISYSKLFTGHFFDERPQISQSFRNSKIIHARILRLGLHLSGKLGNALIDLYSKSGNAICAQKVFNIMETPDQVSWNSILSAYLRAGSSSSVLTAFSSMLRSGLSPDQFSFATVLSACAGLGLIREGRRHHCCMIKVGLNCDRYCEGSLVGMYAKSGLVTEARQVFDEVSKPDVITWTNMIVGCEQAGMAEESMHLFSRMCESGIVPDRVALVAAMTACLSVGRLEDGRNLFKQIQTPNDVAWNAIISGHAQNGHENESLDFFCDMRRRGVRPTRSTMGSILSAAASLQKLGEGYQIHTESIKLGLDSNVFVGSSLINLYIKCGCLEDARRVFNSSWEKNVVTWNAMLGGLLMHGLAEEVIELFLEMKGLEFEPDEVSFVSVVGACACMENLNLGRQFHSLAIKENVEGDVFLGNAIIDMYAKCGDLSDARRQLDFVPVRDVVSWNAIIVGHAHNNGEEEALNMLKMMGLEGVIPDEVSCSSIISACSNVGGIDEGRQMHCLTVKMNLSSNPCVGSSLIDLYAKNGELENAVLVFCQLPEKTLSVRNALINGYVQNNEEDQALALLWEMQLEGMQPSQITFGSILPACNGRRVIMGKILHCHMLKSGFLCGEEFLKSSLLVMYLRSKLLEEANKLFLEMPDSKSLVIWTVVISGYSQNGFSEKALLMFQEMRMSDLGFDEAILASALGACSDLAALTDGRKVHSIIIRTAFQSYKHTSIALIDMYSKCGDVDSSLHLFEAAAEHKKDVVLWNSLIVGLAKNGYGLEALEIFYQMLQSQISPDDITFIGALTACSHAGLIARGRVLFESMVENYGIMPRTHHYACLIDLLGRGGCLKDAEELISELPFEPDGSIWATLLAASRMHEDSEIGEHAAGKLIELEPDNSMPYVMLSSIYATLSNWDGVKRLRHAMRERGVQKLPGYSWIEVGNKRSLFTAGDKFNPNADEMCEVLSDLTALMKDVHFVSDIICFDGWG